MKKKIINSTYHWSDENVHTPFIAKDLKKILSERNFSNLEHLDIGCGNGFITKIINKFFKKTHKTYVLDSTWDVNKNYEFQIYFLNFCKDIIKKNELNLEHWLEFRLKSIKDKNSRFILNNTDFLAIKK